MDVIQCVDEFLVIVVVYRANIDAFRCEFWLRRSREQDESVFAVCIVLNKDLEHCPAEASAGSCECDCDHFD